MVQLDEDQLRALTAWARLGASEDGQLAAYWPLLKRIYAQNSLKLYLLTVRYEPIPETRPPMITRVVELSRPPVRADIDELLRGETYRAESVLVTADPEGLVGWCDLDHFPWA